MTNVETSPPSTKAAKPPLLAPQEASPSSSAFKYFVPSLVESANRLEMGTSTLGGTNSEMGINREFPPIEKGSGVGAGLMVGATLIDGEEVGKSVGE